jgi:four helix bundle protein
MAKVERFEDLMIRQSSYKICVHIYQLSSGLKDYWFKDQLTRASVSIMNNISEWFERQSNKEFSRFLYIAKWPAWEVRSMLQLWISLQYITQDEAKELIEQLVIVSKQISSLIKSISE